MGGRIRKVGKQPARNEIAPNLCSWKRMIDQLFAL